jgi:hypothetical protein
MRYGVLIRQLRMPVTLQSQQETMRGDVRRRSEAAAARLGAGRSASTVMETVCFDRVWLYAETLDPEKR